MIGETQPVYSLSEHLVNPVTGKDLKSFDLLWFDIVTKTRHLIQELVGPLFDKVHE